MLWKLRRPLARRKFSAFPKCTPRPEAFSCRFDRSHRRLESSVSLWHWPSLCPRLGVLADPEECGGLEAAPSYCGQTQRAHAELHSNQFLQMDVQEPRHESWPGREGYEAAACRRFEAVMSPDRSRWLCVSLQVTASIEQVGGLSCKVSSPHTCTPHRYARTESQSAYCNIS